MLSVKDSNNCVLTVLTTWMHLNKKNKIGHVTKISILHHKDIYDETCIVTLQIVKKGSQPKLFLAKESDSIILVSEQNMLHILQQKRFILQRPIEVKIYIQ